MATGVIPAGEFIVATGTVNIPAGSASTPSQTQVDLSAKIPAGYIFVCCQLGAYTLPYFTQSTGQVATWVGYNLDARLLVFQNRVTAWSGYTYLALFRRAS